MNLQTLLFRMGIGTWVQDIATAIPAIASPTFNIGQTLPDDVGFIYGLATYADGMDANNLPLISTVQAQNIYITLKDGPTTFLEQFRLSDLLNEFAGTPVVRPDKFVPVSIPAFDLSKSFYQNPTAIVTGMIHIKIWYIQKNTWKKMKEHFTFEQSRPK